MKSIRYRYCSIAAIAFAGFAASAHAATFTVTTVADSGAGSLRQAIVDANSAGGSNTVNFALTGSGPFTIALSSQLPPINSSLLIDGYSQSGAMPNTNATTAGGLNTVLQIELSGPGGAYAFWLGNGNGIILTVQGLAVHGFIAVLAGYPIAGTSQLRSFGNFLCSNINGTAIAAGASTGFGISTDQTPSFIGGDLPMQRNLISGCANSALSIRGAAGVRGNLIGTDASGTQAIPNGNSSNAPAIIIGGSASNVSIGGTTAARRNVISGNRTFGISINYDNTSATPYSALEILGNYIGTDWSGLLALPNGYADPNFAQYGGGIQFSTTSTNPTAAIIGGFGVDDANLIAYNNGAGIIAASNTPGESFDSRRNRIHHNHAVGRANLDIGVVGPTPNDLDDTDSGSNAQQNWPEILSASQVGDQLTLTYRIDSATIHAAYPLRVDFYRDAQSGGDLWLGQDSYPAISAQVSRMLTITVPVGVQAIPMVATATDAAGHSSEFSPAFDVIFEDDFD